MWQCERCKRVFEKQNQNHYCGTDENIDVYISDQAEEVRPLLERIRETIRAAAPDASERMSWQMPTFWQGEYLIHFAAFKKHISIFPGEEAVYFFSERLDEYKASKGTIQFSLSKPIPYELIGDIVRWRVEKLKNDEKSNKNMVTSRMTRTIYDIPDYVTEALEERGLWERYRKRPVYQRNDYIGWITRAKREETRMKRLTQMLEELQAGEEYMGMKYKAK